MPALGLCSLVDNQIDAGTGTFRLKATFDNKDNTLWPGQFVNARLLLRVRRDVATVPTEVIQRGAKGPFAYAVKSDQSVEQRAVRVGYSREGVTIVEEGLAVDEVVVLDGQYKLRPGARIQATLSGERRPRQVSSTSRPDLTP